MYNQSSTKILPKMQGIHYNFFYKVVPIYLENLNLFKMGVITLIKILIQLCKKGSIVQLGFNGGSNKI